MALASGAALDIPRERAEHSPKVIDRQLHRSSSLLLETTLLKFIKIVGSEIRESERERERTESSIGLLLTNKET